MEDSLSLGIQNVEVSVSLINYLAILISIIGLLISGGVFFMHFRRDIRESKKHKKEEKNAEKKVQISTSGISYLFERGLERAGMEYYEDHIVSFDCVFRSNGNPTVYPETIVIDFLKPLTGEVIKTFTFNLNPSKKKFNLGEELPFRFSQAFESYEIADTLIKSSIKIKLTDIQGDRFETPLLKLEAEPY